MRCAMENTQWTCVWGGGGGWCYDYDGISDHGSIFYRLLNMCSCSFS